MLYIGAETSFSIATYKNGLWKLEGNMEDVNDRIFTIAEDADKNIWLGTFIHGIMKIVPSEDLLKPKKISAYAEKNKGLFSTDSLQKLYIANFP